jgi:hypothetical protein
MQCGDWLIVAGNDDFSAWLQAVNNFQAGWIVRLLV